MSITAKIICLFVTENVVLLEYSKICKKGYSTGSENMNLDKLTHLLYYDDFKDEAARIVEREDKDFVLISMNISNFKYINDVYGYEVGDRLLKHLADFFHFYNENSRLASRMHADRFLVLTEGHGDSNVTLLDRFLNRHKRFSEEMEKLYPMCTIHINAGACRVEPGFRSISEIVDKAEIARKSISDSYVETIAFYNEKLADQKDMERRIIPVFERAIEEERVLIYLQPKFTIDTQELVGAEALVRLVDKNGQILSPNLFIPVLERAGMISDLDGYVAEQIYRLVDSWMERQMEPIPVSINLSRLDLTNEEKWQGFQRRLSPYKVPKKYIEYEVTETVFLDDLNYITGKIGNIQKDGYKVSMDDFGAGYSSLNTVGILPIDIVKFDRGFVQNSINTRKGVEIISGMIEIFKRIGLEVICEGVETREEEQMVAACGCNLVQGYLHDRPIPIAEFEQKYMEPRRAVCF